MAEDDFVAAGHLESVYESFAAAVAHAKLFSTDLQEWAQLVWGALTSMEYSTPHAQLLQAQVGLVCSRISALGVEWQTEVLPQLENAEQAARSNALAAAAKLSR